MYRYTLKINGRMCGMCEAHVNDSLRNTLGVKKVTSSHAKGETEIITDNAPDEALIREAVEKSGYKVLGITSEPYEKKGFSLFKKK